MYELEVHECECMSALLTPSHKESLNIMKSGVLIPVQAFLYVYHAGTGKSSRHIYTDSHESSDNPRIDHVPQCKATSI